MVDVKGYSIKTIIESHVGAYTNLHGLHAKVKEDNGEWSSGIISVVNDIIYFESNSVHWNGGHISCFPQYKYSWHVKCLIGGIAEGDHRVIVTQNITESVTTDPFADIDLDGEVQVNAKEKQGVDLSSLLEDDDEIVLSNKLK